MGKWQGVYHRPDQAVLHRLAQLDINLAGRVEDFGVKLVKGQDAHADGAAHRGQPPPRRASLQVDGDDDARDRGQATAGVTGAGQGGGGLARGGGGEVEVGGHGR